jgi:hypothetical protein
MMRKILVAIFALLAGGSGWAQAAPTSVVNVVQLGADPTGVADSAPAFRAAIASNRKVVVPAGQYRFKSTVSPPCCAMDNAAVLVSGQFNFAVTGQGAVTIFADPSIAHSSLFHFDQDRRFSLTGLTLRGDRTGLRPTQENVGIAFTSDTDVAVQQLTFAGGFGGEGAGIAGDWLVRARFSRLTFDGVGQCFDVAFLKLVSIDRLVGRGADAAGQPGGGAKCISVINDKPNAATNHTGVAYDASDGVRVGRADVSGFATGAYLASGTNLAFSANVWHDNTQAGGRGIGVFVQRVASGPFASDNHPPGRITITGDRFENNMGPAGECDVLIGVPGVHDPSLEQGVVVNKAPGPTPAAKADPACR